MNKSLCKTMLNVGYSVNFLVKFCEVMIINFTPFVKKILKMCHKYFYYCHEEFQKA